MDRRVGVEEEPGKGMVVEGPEVGDEVMKEWELKLWRRLRSRH